MHANVSVHLCLCLCVYSCVSVHAWGSLIHTQGFHSTCQAKILGLKSIIKFQGEVKG